MGLRVPYRGLWGALRGLKGFQGPERASRGLKVAQHVRVDCSAKSMIKYKPGKSEII